MNKKMLQKTKFKRVRIQPYPYKRTLSGDKKVKEPWFVEDVRDNFIEISLQSTGHRKEIGLDHVKEFMTDSQYGSEGIIKAYYESQYKPDALHIVDIKKAREYGIYPLWWII